MDFGRITVDDTLVMYLFGTPGQERFGFMWDDICTVPSAPSCWSTPAASTNASPPSTTSRQRGVPFVVGVNHFDGSHRYPLDEVREALEIPNDVPVVACDAREKGTAKMALVTLLESLVQRAALAAT